MINERFEIRKVRCAGYLSLGEQTRFTSKR